MAKQQGMFPVNAGGGLLRKVVGLAVVAAVLMLVIRYPHEAATWTSGGFRLAGEVVTGLATFLRNLFG